MNPWRTHVAAQVPTLDAGTAVRVAGRLRAEGGGFALVDASGACVVRTTAALHAGDIVSVSGRVDAHMLVAVDVVVLARALRDPARDAEHARLSDPALTRALALGARLRAEVRAYFAERDFLEVETGLLTDEPGQEPYLEPLRLARTPRYFVTSPELRLKRMLAAGQERIVELGHVVRGGLGERSDRHHPEFTLVEWYRAYEDDTALIADLEALFARAAVALTGTPEFVRAGARARLDGGFERVSVKDAFLRHAGVDLEPFLDGAFEAFRAAVRAAGMPVRADEDPEQIFFRILLDRVEPQLGRERPVILHSYPASMAALARLDPNDARVAQRFECYALGLELANGFVELTDPVEQRARFEHERTVRSRTGRESLPEPTRFLEALERGVPPCAGIALGLDRVLMLILGLARIDDALAFPEPRDIVW